VRLKDGRWILGELRVFSNALEIRYREPDRIAGDHQKLSYILYEENLQNLDKIVRLSPRAGTPEYDLWRKEIQRVKQPSFGSRAARRLRNAFNILRDAFAQSVPLVFGAVKKRTVLGRVPLPDDRVTDVSKSLFLVVPNAFEPILESYRGKSVVVEKFGPTIQEHVGLLQEYTAKYILARDVRLLEDLPADGRVRVLPTDEFDVIFPRHSHLVRHLAGVAPAAVKPAPAPRVSERPDRTAVSS
jgi:hypothetical protein